jgi:glucose/arabinose dehydrogenase
MRRRAILAAVLLSTLAAAPAAAAPSLVPVGTFDQPVHVAAPPGDATQLFVVERPGRVQVVAGGQKALFLDATDVVNDSGSEQGLLSIAFAPDFATSGLYYVFYTDNAGNLVVREGSGGTLGRTLFTVPHPGETNHNGGQLAAAGRATPATTRSASTASSARSCASTHARAQRRRSTLWVCATPGDSRSIARRAT